MRLESEMLQRLSGSAPPTGDGVRPPGSVVVLRLVGSAVALFTILTSATSDPAVGTSGDGLLVALCLALFAGGIFAGAPGRELAVGRRFGALLAIAAGSVGLIALQGDGTSAITGLYMAVIFAALRLPDRQALVVSAVAVGGGALAYGLSPDGSGSVYGVLFGIPPWFLTMRVMRSQRTRQIESDALVEELRASRAAEAAAAAEAERTRVARDLHDVLAHSLSALAIQLELARVQAHGGDAALEATVTDAHARAVRGLEEARRAIGALRGDDLPGPERIGELVAAFAADAGVPAELTVTGEPRELASEARVALYRVAQEALTNVRRHAEDPGRVDATLDWEVGGVRLTVADRARVAAGARAGGGGDASGGAGGSAPFGSEAAEHAGIRTRRRAPGGGGHGLTGMRERAELLGGRLAAGPDRDGFRVALWLPA